MSNITKTIASVVGLLLVGGVAAFSFMPKGNNSSQSATPTITTSDATKELTVVPTNTATETGTSDTTVAPAQPVSGYKDGTYTATGSYRTPEGSEQVTVTLSLKDGVVTDSSTTFAAAQAHESKQYQSQFSSGYKQYVVGKNIDEVSLSRVSGSSLTPKGFNAALEQIKTQAKA